MLAGTPKNNLIKISLFLIAMGLAVGILELVDRRPPPSKPSETGTPGTTIQ